MNTYSLVHLSDAAVIQGGKSSHSVERGATALSLAHLSEIDARRLYAGEGYSSMFLYCVEELHLSEDCASRRIQAARVARRFPVLFAALADGRLHLTGMALLAPFFTPENFDELLQACTHRSRAQIQEWLATRFPETVSPAVRASIRPVVSAPVHVKSTTTVATDGQLLASFGASDAPKAENGHAIENGHRAENSPMEKARVSTENAPVPARQFQLTVTVPGSTHEKLKYLQSLLSHSLAAGDLAQLIDRAFDALIEKVEKRKFGSPAKEPAETAPSCPVRVAAAARVMRPRTNRAPSRYISVQVRRAVWDRDQGRCTFVSTSGHRCSERRFLEFDHIQPLARGGPSTVDGLRLRCRAHNQYEADRILGAGFMNGKREEARRLRTGLDDETRDIINALRGLGCRHDEAQRAALKSAELHCTSFGERLRAALTFVGRVRPTPVPSAP